MDLTSVWCIWELCTTDDDYNYKYYYDYYYYYFANKYKYYYYIVNKYKCSIKFKKTSK